MAIAVENAACSCGKVVYVTQREARTVAKRSGRPLRPYRCKESDGWHLTSRPKVAKSHRPELAENPKTARQARKRRKHHRQAPRVLAIVVSKPRPKSPPARTACKSCRRPWLSDLDPTGRNCPRCGGEIRIGRDAHRFEARQLA